MSLELERNRLDDLKISLEKEKAKLEENCNSPESVRQIQLIASAILRKNHKFVEKVSETTKKIQDISSRLKRTKTQMDAMEVQLKSERRTTFYQILEAKY